MVIDCAKLQKYLHLSIMFFLMDYGLGFIVGQKTRRSAPIYWVFPLSTTSLA